MIFSSKQYDFINRDCCHYDIKELTLNGGKMNITYTSSTDVSQIGNKTISILKNKKLTNSKAIAINDDFVYYSDADEPW